MFQRLAARGMPGLKLDGTLGSNFEAQWTGPANVKLNGSLNGSDLSVESPSLGRDVIRLAKVQASCKATRQDKQLTVEEAKIDCDVGNLAASGHVDLGERGLAVAGRPAASARLRGARHARPGPACPAAPRHAACPLRHGDHLRAGPVDRSDDQSGGRTSSGLSADAAAHRPGMAGPAWKPTTSRRPIMAGKSPGTSPCRSTSPSTKPIKGR